MADKTVLVTGAATGLGKAVALRLSRDGYTVAVADVEGTGAKKVAQEMSTVVGASSGASSTSRTRRPSPKRSTASSRSSVGCTDW